MDQKKFAFLILFCYYFLMTDEAEFQYIANEDHYEKVIERIRDCKKNSLDWNGRHKGPLRKRRKRNKTIS